MFKKTRIHFIGIGGIGMSGIAEVLLNLGHTVSGSDLKESILTTRLASLGATTFYGHRSEQAQNSDVVVISSAVKPDNPEWIEARKRGIPVIPRAEMLSELMRMKYGIAVAGSHGKTTTTSLIGSLLDAAGMDPTLVIGGRVKSFQSNAKLGKGEFLVAEADESDGSFVHLHPTMVVLTNIDPEHLDHYQTFEELKSAFVRFANHIPFYGAVVACLDHPTVRQILPQIQKRVISYGLEDNADFYARNIQQKGLQSHFEVYHLGEKLGKIHSNLAGLHNVYNALAAIAVGCELEIPFEAMAEGFAHFKGIERRMETLHQGKEIWVLDDYGHHPEEIKATLSALRIAFPQKRIITLFQPHRYSRTKDLFEEFKQAFGNTDLLMLTEIYAAGEESIDGISGEALANSLAAIRSKERTLFLNNKDQLFEQLTQIAQPNDVIVTLGAGDIVQVGKRFADWLGKKA